MPIDAKQLAAVRKLLGHADFDTVRQGLELARAIADAELWGTLAEGASIDASGCVQVASDSEIHTRVRAGFRLEVALHALRGAGRLDAVHKLALADVPLHDVDALTGLAGLTELDLRRCPIRNVDGLRGLTGLTKLRLDGCMGLTNLDGLVDSPSLADLGLEGCRSLTSVEGLAGNKGLAKLSIRHCPALGSLRGLHAAEGLQQLLLTSCEALRDLGLAGSTCLRILEVWRCPSLADLGGLRGVPGLTKLTLNDCDALTNLDALADVPSLAELSLVDCPAVTDVDALRAHPGLESVFLRCPALSDLRGVHGMPRLAKLHVGSNGAAGALKSLEGLGALPLLRSLTLESLPALSDLTALGALPLEQLTIQHVPLTETHALAGHTGLQSLELRSKELASVEGLRGLSGLRTVNLSGCEALTSLVGLEGLHALEELDVRYSGVRDLDALAGLPALRIVDASSSALTQADALAKLTKLERIDLQGCPSLPAHLRRGARLVAGYSKDTREMIGADAVAKLQKSISTDAAKRAKAAAALSAPAGRAGGGASVAAQTDAILSLASKRNEGTAREGLALLAACTNVGVFEKLAAGVTVGPEGYLELEGPLADVNGDVRHEAALLSLRRVGWLAAVRALDVHGVRDATLFEGLPELRALAVRSCALTSPLALSGSPGLQRLSIHAASNLEGLERLTELEELVLEHAGAIPRFDGIAALTKLRSLTITHAALTDVAFLRGLVGLESVSLRYCARLTSVRVLDGLPRLHELNVNGCEALPRAERTTGLTGRHVVVTGGSGALGSAVVTALLAVGARVSVPSTDAAGSTPPGASLFALPLGPLAPIGSAGGARVYGGVDLCDEAQVEAFYERACADAGPVWASVHLVGAFAAAPLMETTVADWRRMLELNATTAFCATRAAVRRMGAGGRIVNVGAEVARKALHQGEGKAAYAASKGALLTFTEACAMELAPRNVVVSAVAPGTLDTPANRAAMPNANFAVWTALPTLAARIVEMCAPSWGRRGIYEEAS